MYAKSINYKITDIFLELTMLLKNDELTKKVVSKEIKRLYREYLKLYVKVNRMLPEYDEGKFKGAINCYFYALDLSLPYIFKESFERITNLPFYTNVGEISGLKYFRDNFIVPTPNDLLNYVYTDLDTLKIKVYNSEINAKTKHNGYKIALFLENNKRSDYHFVRQNIDGSWSSKIGYRGYIVKGDNPMTFLDEIHNYDYEYIKTLELVKPSFKR